MPEHFTRNTVSASFWCSKCKKYTQHRIDDRRKGPCLECIARLDVQHANAGESSKLRTEAPKQEDLFPL